MTEDVKTEQQTITIDGTDYVFDDLGENAQAAVLQLMDINQGLQRLQAQAQQLEMARNGFNQALSEALAADAGGDEAPVEIDTTN